MAEDCVNHAATLADLPDSPCLTKTLNIHGFHPNAATFGLLSFYGTDAPAIQQLAAQDPLLADSLDIQLPYIGAEVIWAARNEMARTVEDVLSRRTRALFLNSKAAVRMAPRVAELLARELSHDDAWQSEQIARFTELAKGYQVAV
jgi:glycerol-3-phosphate dehydrogenase